MPVYKYRSVEEMPDPAIMLDAGDPAIPDKIRFLWQLSGALVNGVGTCIPRGVRKYRSIEEANADRDRWEQERVDRIRARNERTRHS
ncbi:MAG: hypothetical protein JO197_21070 [Acidobacteria bacterium]|nr:hypothetical protein [Acidobacteriota bacterium]MBV9476865.1 hypothetical protein [Acidobacteriota bacterium]